MNLYEYEEFSEETKSFFNKAMDIYSTIKDMTIAKNVNFAKTVSFYTFTNTDKKIVALYIAFFLTGGDLKDILDDFENIKVDKLLRFINIKEKQIKPLSQNEYSEFYEKKFKLDLLMITKEKNWYYDFDRITPEFIFCCLDSVRVNDSSILNYLGAECCLLNNTPFLTGHPSFNAVKNYALLKKLMIG